MQNIEIVKGLLVRLALGATIDTQLGPRSRPRRYVVDADSPDGRRAVAADVDGNGNENPPLVGVVLGLHRRGRGDVLVEVEFPDLARGEIDASQLERVGDAPTSERERQKDEPPSGSLAQFIGERVEAATGAALTPLADRIHTLTISTDDAHTGLKQVAATIARLEAELFNLSKACHAEAEKTRALAAEVQRLGAAEQ